MNIGVPKERRLSEYRVGLSPAGVQLLTQDGHTCYVESKAGIGAGFSDEEFQHAGAKIVYSGEEAYGRADLVLKAARPTDQELEWFVPGQALAGLLHLPAARPNKVEALIENQITAIAYDQIQREDGVLPVLKPLSQIGGKMAAHVAAQLLQNNAGGKGVLLGGVPGVPSAEVIIVGGGVVGETAAKAFLALGAQVTVLDSSLDRLQILDNHMNGRLVTLVAHPFNLARACSYADVLIGAVHVPGERAPLVITREMVKKMRKGAVFLDLSIDEGGCSETSRPTSHQNPTYVEEGVLHCCIPNLPGVVARTATHAFLNAAWPYIQEIANTGI
ncbi:MAG TPA: alanine dehydrogenase, partial [Anaerolineales bacterium]|nr:alanine dehydrogenase [Anaerolineales bacterium]